jgi:uncharacterized membrane protein
MVTPLIMLGLLVGPYLLIRPLRPAAGGAAGRLGLALLFLFTCAGHFIAPAELAQMLPPWAPRPIALIYLSGVVELAAGAAVLLQSTRRAAGWFIIVLLAALLPLNIYAALERAPVGGHAWGPVYLLIRVPLQAFIAWWSWLFAARRTRAEPATRTNPP